MHAKSSAFFTLMALFQQMNATKREYDMKATDIQGSTYARRSVGHQSHRLREPIIVANQELIKMCTRAEWYMVGTIMYEMYEYNALWLADKDKKRASREYRRTLAGLVAKGILFPTETTHMYLVNPVHLRRGDPFAVVATTANMLMGKKPDVHMLGDRRPVHKLDFSTQLPGISAGTVST